MHSSMRGCLSGSQLLTMANNAAVDTPDPIPASRDVYREVTQLGHMTDLFPTNDRTSALFSTVAVPI